MSNRSRGSEELSESAGEIDGEGAFADAAFAGGDGDGVFDGLGSGGVTSEVATGGSRFCRSDRHVDEGGLNAGQGAKAFFDFLLEVKGDLRVGGR